MLREALDSAWHHPAVCFASVALLFLVLARRLAFKDGFIVLFGFVILADALVSGALSPVEAARRTPYEIAFVILGDLRYFVLVERHAPRGLGRLAGEPIRGSGAHSLRETLTLARAIALAFVVPLITAACILMGRLPDMRSKFLFYEVAFFVFALAFRFVILPRYFRGAARGPAREFLTALTHFELLQYGLWIVADTLLIQGHDWARILRLTADVMYYGAFLPFVWTRAPESPMRARAVPITLGVVAAGIALSFVSVITGPRAAPEPVAALGFVDQGRNAAGVSLAQMTSGMPAVTIDAFDPYYGRTKRWRAVPIESIVQKGFGRDPGSLMAEDFVLRARDGYTTNISGQRLLEGGAHVAFADLEVPAWEPIGPQRANPGPFYVVWSKPTQQELKTHPRPWQLASIEIISFDKEFPHVRPTDVSPTSPAALGFRTFRDRCLACHAINCAGGHVGPDLNVPRNVLEYRTTPDVRAYIKNPRAFRYGTMPAHPDLSETNIDELIAYLDTMKTQKHDDPNAAGAAPH